MKTFKTEFYPTAEQAEYIRRACGVRRWTWNWAVEQYFAAAKNDFFMTAYMLNTKLNHDVVPNKPWLSEVNSMARSEALKDFGLAIKAYVEARRRSKRTVEKIPVDKYKPSFKKKGKCTESFRLQKKNDSVFQVHSAHDISLVTVRGKQRLHIHPLESVAFLMSADIKTCTISIKGDKFFISLTYERTNQCQRKCGNGKVGIDLGIKHAATVWNGEASRFIDIPESLRNAEKRTERCNQRLSRSQPGSHRHAKLLVQLQRAYMHETNIKKDWREKVTTALVAENKTIVIDDFGFEGAKNLDCCRALYRVGTFLFKLRLNQKASEAGTEVIYVPKGTPTTQTCSRCGKRPEAKIGLNERTYVCEHCGFTIDRDVNAAINTYNYC